MYFDGVHSIDLDTGPCLTLGVGWGIAVSAVLNIRQSEAAAEAELPIFIISIFIRGAKDHGQHSQPQNVGK